MRYTCFALTAILISMPAYAYDTGFNNTPGWSDGGENGGIKYYHGDDSSNGWQSSTSGNTYYHSDKSNCWSNVGAVTQTTCIPY